MQLLPALLCIPALCAPPSSQGVSAGVAVRDVPEYVFQTPLIRGVGEKRLSDFRGQPVLVQFWNSTLWGAVDDMMKLMLRVQLEHEDDLQVILVESRLAPAALERLLLEKGWLGTRAVWTTERPFAHGSGRDPCCVLLSCEGAVILKSPDLGAEYSRTYSNQFLDEVDAAVAAEIERRYGLLPDSPPALRKASGDFADGKLARALASVRDLSGSEPAAHMLATFERHLDRRIGQAEFFLGRGRVGEAEAVLVPLVGALVLGDGAAQRLAALRGQLASEASKAERDADRALAKLEKTLFAEGASARTAGALRVVAKQHEGTRRGAEAARLAGLLEAD